MSVAFRVQRASVASRAVERVAIAKYPTRQRSGHLHSCGKILNISISGLSQRLRSYRPWNCSPVHLNSCTHFNYKISPHPTPLSLVSVVERVVFVLGADEKHETSDLYLSMSIMRIKNSALLKKKKNPLIRGSDPFQKSTAVDRVPRDGAYTKHDQICIA